MATVALVAACAGDSSTTASATSDAAAPAAAAAKPDVKLTGRIIQVEMFSDEHGNYFKPNRIEAHRGDIVRFVLRSGVHNVHFVADSNPGRKGLPPASDYLQLPGQEYDVVVSFAEGDYYFQCDPHALLGMIGELEVEDDDD